METVFSPMSERVWCQTRIREQLSALYVTLLQQKVLHGQCGATNAWGRSHHHFWDLFSDEHVLYSCCSRWKQLFSCQTASIRFIVYLPGQSEAWLWPISFYMVLLQGSQDGCVFSISVPKLNKHSDVPLLMDNISNYIENILKYSRVLVWNSSLLIIKIWRVNLVLKKPQG